MSNLLQAEVETYTAMWAVDQYAAYAPGERYVPLFLDMADPSTSHTFLDAGCGTGKGALALDAAGYHDIRLCDLTDAGLVDEAKAFRFSTVCLWSPIHPQMSYLRGRSVDWVYCADVLEHIPTPFTMLVVSRLLEVSRRGVFLSISLMPDDYGVWVGKALHQSLQTFPQWRDQLAAIGTVKESRDLLHTALFLIVPTC